MAGASTRFPGWTKENIDSGITYSVVDGEECAYIRKKHPIIDYLNEVRKVNGEPALADDDLIEGTGLYIVSAPDVRKCLEIMKRELWPSDGHAVKAARKRG